MGSSYVIQATQQTAERRPGGITINKLERIVLM